MKRLTMLLLLLVAMTSLQACETAKGFKKDVAYMFSPDEPSEDYKDNWVYKTDAWIRENLW